MDGDGKGVRLQSSPTFVGYPIGTTNNHDDNVDVSGLSTILVATIQDAKDNISQIEYIFCSKIFPNFLSRFKTLDKFNSEFRKTVEGEFKLKEDQYLAQIVKFQAELDRVIDENRELKVENQRVMMNSREFVYKGKRIEELEVELNRRNEEVDEGMRLHNNLLELVQSKERLLKDSEEKRIGLVVKVKCLEEKVENLEDVVRRKSEKLASEAEMREELNTSNSDVTIRIENCEKEKKRLQGMIEELEGNVASAQRDLRYKMEELEEGQELLKKLRRHVELKDLEVFEYKKRRDECEVEKKLIQDKVNALEKQVSEQIREAHNDNEKLYEQLQLKNHELQGEKHKRRELVDAYKRLKSQYKFLCAKYGLQTENIIHQNRSQAGTNLYRHDCSPMPIPVTIDSINPDATMVACYANKEKNEVVEGDSGAKKKVSLSSFVGTKGARPSNSSLLPVSEQLRHASWEDKSPITNLAARDTCIVKKENLENENGENNSPRSFTIDPKFPHNPKYPSVSGTKRPAYSWRDTRARQHSRGGSDPHDDFLDTPLENVRGNLNKVPKEDPHDIPITMEKDMDVGSSDDETQDLNAKPSPQQQQGHFPLANQSSFKYIEPVRKKAERENLKGVECKQCKKFYDAVLPDKAGNDSDSNKRGFRCEHLDGVSRHRYRYIPPLTPEGFWNIGFESEM